MTVDLAVAHWAQSINGGGERVGWELARTFDVPLCVGEKSEECAPDDVEVVDLFADSIYGRLLRRGGAAQMAASQLAWETPTELLDADVLVTSGNEPLSYVPHPEQAWVHYVHHTSRKATDRLPAVGGGVGGFVERLARKAERQLYSRYAQKPTLLVANSEPVARRIRQYWGVPAERIRVVYPPVDVDAYGPDRTPTQDYHLALQRLDDHKRIGELIDAYATLDVPLKIAGDGPKRDRLERMAADAENVELLGYVPEERKRDLLSGAAAKVVNAEREDFGLTTAEALASGTPVIGVQEGMTQHLVIDGVTGVGYDRGVENLHEAVRRFGDGIAVPENAIARWADQFGVERFREAMRDAVRTARDRHAIDPDLDPVPRKDAAVADGGKP